MKRTEAGLDRPAFFVAGASRRRVLCAGVALLAGTKTVIAQMNEQPPTGAVQPTPYVDTGHPDVQAVARRIGEGAADDRERAVRLHDFVRDEVRFGFAASFYDQTASQVLQAGVGYCNTKSTLFVALLRALGIPARQHFVDIRADILHGVINPGTLYVDHSYAEVWLGGRWLKLDSYIVDAPLMQQVQDRLRREGRVLGYGAHRNGVSVWDGRSDAFSQFVDDGSVPDLGRRDHGVFDDVAAFYRSGRGLNILSTTMRLIFPWASHAANRKLDALRRAA